MTPQEERQLLKLLQKKYHETQLEEGKIEPSGVTLKITNNKKSELPHVPHNNERNILFERKKNERLSLEYLTKYMKEEDIFFELLTSKVLKYDDIKKNPKNFTNEGSIVDEWFEIIDNKPQRKSLRTWFVELCPPNGIIFEE